MVARDDINTLITSKSRNRFDTKSRDQVEEETYQLNPSVSHKFYLVPYHGVEQMEGIDSSVRNFVSKLLVVLGNDNLSMRRYLI